MEPFVRLEAVALPLVRDNIDTDAIIPSREITAVAKTGLKDGLFAGWRYRTIGGRDPDPTFVLNQPAFAGAQIVLGGANFGCGSSREHAVWALAEHGFRAVVAPSFNPIFRGNCTRNGILPVVLDPAAIQALVGATEADPQRRHIIIDLVDQFVSAAGLPPMAFDIADEPKAVLLHGLDAIDLTLRDSDAITAFIATDQRMRGWAYLDKQGQQDG